MTSYLDSPEVTEELRRIRDGESTNGTEPIAEGFRLETLSARDLCALPDPANQEILGPALVRGYRTALGAGTGEGKTTMTLQIIRAALLREEFLGFRSAGCGRALFLDAEQGARSLKRRLREAELADCDDLDIIRAPDGLSLNADPQQIAALEARLAAGEYGVVALDPLYKLHQADSNEERGAVDLMRTLDGMRERYGFALLLPMHLRKPPSGAKFTIHEFFGSSAYLRGAEVVLGLQRVRDGYSRLHFFKDRDGDLPVGQRWGLLFDRENGFHRDPDDEKPKQTTKDLIAELLAAQPDMTKEQLVEATGKTDKTVREALKKLGATERTAAHGLKLWSVAEEIES